MIVTGLPLCLHSCLDPGYSTVEGPKVEHQPLYSHAAGDPPDEALSPSSGLDLLPSPQMFLEVIPEQELEKLCENLIACPELMTDFTLDDPGILSHTF